MIPKQIFQTHKSIEYINRHRKLVSATNSWKKSTKLGYAYYFFSNEKCELFIKDNFDSDIYNAYMKLPISVMKADLWRYCVIYKYGGIYADADTICHVNPDIFILNNNSLLTFVPENDVHLCQWVFAAPPNSPVLKTIIDLCVDRILKSTFDEGEHLIHYLTGPGVFTNGINKFVHETLGMKTPTNINLYTKFPKPNIFKVFQPNIFHSKIVTHLFFGGREGGWTHEREKFSNFKNSN